MSKTLSSIKYYQGNDFMAPMTCSTRHHLKHNTCLFLSENLLNYYQCGFAPREKMQNKGTWENRFIHSTPLKVRINQERKFLKVFFLFPTGFRLWKEN